MTHHKNQQDYFLSQCVSVKNSLTEVPEVVVPKPGLCRQSTPIWVFFFAPCELEILGKLLASLTLSFLVYTIGVMMHLSQNNGVKLSA